MSMDVSSKTSIPNSNGYANSQIIERAGGVSDAVGTGAVAGVPQAPDPVPGVSFGTLMASLAPLMPRISGDQLDVLVASFTEKAKDVSDASDRDQIKTKEEAKSAALKQKKANSDYAIKKQAEAEDKIKSASVWDKIKLAFEYVGAILTILGGIATIAVGCLTAPTGVGLALGIIGGTAMIASGLCMLTMAVDATVQIAQEDQGKGDLGMFGKMCKDIAKSRGMSEEDAEAVGQKGAMGASISIGALSAIFGLAGGVAGVGSLVASAGTVAMTGAGLAAEGADMAARGAEMVVDGADMAERAAAMGEEGAELAEQGAAMGEKGAAMMEKGEAMAAKGMAMAEKASAAADRGSSAAGWTAKISSGVVDLGGDANAIAGAGADVGSEVEHFQATSLQADAKQAQATTKRFQALQQRFDDAIDLAMNHMKARNDAFNEVIDGIVEAMNDLNQSLTAIGNRA